MAIRATISLVKAEAATSFRKVETQTTYENSNITEIWLDPDSKNKFINDELPLNDVTFRVVSKILADTTSITELYASHFTKGTIAESVSVSDNFARVIAWQRSFTDAFTLDDLSQIDKDFYGNKGNIFAFTDIVGLTHNKALVDSYTVGDVFTKVVAYSRSFSDSYSFTDSDYYAFGKNPSDSLTFPDTQVKGFIKPEVDSFTFADIAGKHPSLPKVDSFSFTDSSYFSANKGASDSISFADSHYRTLTKIIADAFALDDSTLIDKDFYGSKGNICTIADVVAFAVTYKRTYTDSFAFNDTTITELAKVINDVVTMTESTAFAQSKEDIDTLGLVELMASSVDKVFSLDQTTLSDNSYNWVNKGIADSVLFNDSTFSEITKVINDTFVLDDSTLINKDYFGSKGNVCTVSDIISFAFHWNRAFGHPISFSDEDSYFLGKNIQGAGESIGMSDLVALTTISGRVLNGASINTTTLN